MKVLGLTILEEFATKHSNVRGQVSSWLAEVMSANWKIPADINARYATASFLPNNYVIFNLKGTKYRLEVLVGFKSGNVIIKRIATHAEYSKW
jgi:mRNA interferase HigB